MKNEILLKGLKWDWRKFWRKQSRYNPLFLATNSAHSVPTLHFVLLFPIIPYTTLLMQGISLFFIVPVQLAFLFFKLHFWSKFGANRPSTGTTAALFICVKNERIMMGCYFGSLRTIRVNAHRDRERSRVQDCRGREIKSQGKEKSATFKQYLADKLLYQRMLSIYERHGLR